MRFWRTGKRKIIVYMPIDNPDFKMIVAEYDEEPFFLAMGASKRRIKRVEAAASLVLGKGEYNMGKELGWEYIYNPKVLEGFMSLEDAKEFMTVAVSGLSMQTSAKEKYRPIPLTKESEIDEILEGVKSEYDVENLEHLRKELTRWTRHHI